ncbi:hypothetical protein KFK09_005859 [Dendrobium nobile]|uniref:Uncharacterized protein n=1 Tax=Dendrobium nobile TaxID=94219 RepID=A0A8T3BWW6_DENNO|nr:hypothetical protein KFK09_005859 [Dendrobium nobile]
MPPYGGIGVQHGLMVMVVEVDVQHDVVLVVVSNIEGAHPLIPLLPLSISYCNIEGVTCGTNSIDSPILGGIYGSLEPEDYAAPSPMDVIVPDIPIENGGANDGLDVLVLDIVGNIVDEPLSNAPIYFGSNVASAA